MNRSNRLASSTRHLVRHPALARAAVEAVEARRLLSSVSGTVYNDVNANGTRQAGEAALVSEVIYADVNNNNTYNAGDVATRADANGVYKLTNLPTNGKTLTIRVRGDDGARVVTPAGNGYAVKFTTSADLTGKDFAVKPATTTPPPATTVTVTGRAFYDRDFSGTYSSGDTTTSTIVFADLNANFQLDAGEPSATPAADGTFTITNAPASKTFNLVALGINGAGTGKGLTITTPAAGGTLGGVAIYSQPATTPTTATLTGRVTNDANGNGVADSSETGINSEVVYLDRNNNATYDTGDVAVRTDANGYYSIPNLTLDGSVVAIRLRSIVAPRTVTGVTAYVTNLTAAAAKASFNFTVASTTPQPTAATITGRINDDANQNGVADTGEGGLANVLVYADYNGDGVYDVNTEPHAITNSAGIYSLTTKPGAFTVRVGNPSLYDVDTTYASSPNGMYFGEIPVSQTGPAANAGRALTATAGATTGNVNFSAVNAAYVRVAPKLLNLTEFETFHYSHQVTYAWIDANKDGVREANEALVQIDPNSIYAQSNTAPYAYLEFFLPRGTYQLDFSTSSAVGAKATATLTTTVSASSATVIRQSVTVPTAVAGLLGHLFADANGNGVRDSGEAAMAFPYAVTVYADYNGNNLVDPGEPTAEVYNDPDNPGDAGGYSLTGIDPTRTFTVKLGGLDTGYVQTNTPQPAVGANQFLTSQDIGVAVADHASVTGRVADASNRGTANITAYADYNGNGVLDAGEPSAKTNSAGVYSFTTTLSDFFVRIATVGSGYIQATPTSGNGIEVDVRHLARKDNVNFSVVPSATITGRITRDANGNGVADNGEVGLAGVTVFADYAGNGHYYYGEPTAVTNAAGVYSLETTRSAFAVRIFNPSSYQASEDLSNGSGGDALYVQTGPSGLNAGVAIDVTSKAQLNNVNFSVVSAGYAVVAPQTTAADASLKDLFGVGGPVYIWVDANGNGLRDANEPLISKDSTPIPSPPNGPEYSYYPVLLPAGVTSQIAFAASSAVGTKATTLYTTTVAANAAPAYPVSVTVQTTESGVFAQAATGNTNPYIVEGITVYADYNNNGVRDADEPETDVYGDIYGIREGNNYFYLAVDANRTFTLRAFGGYPSSSQSNPPVLTVAPNTTVTDVDLGYSL